MLTLPLKQSSALPLPVPSLSAVNVQHPRHWEVYSLLWPNALDAANLALEARMPGCLCFPLNTEITYSNVVMSYYKSKGFLKNTHMWRIGTNFRCIYLSCTIRNASEQKSRF